MTKKAELVLIPSPGISHFVPMTQFAKCLLDRDQRLSITIIVICPAVAVAEIEANIASIAKSDDNRIRCITISVESEPPYLFECPEKLLSDYMEDNKRQVEQAILTQILSDDDSVQLTGIVVDLFCSSMIEFAHKLKIPAYVFFTSNAAFLGFMLHLPVHHGEVGADHFDASSDPKSTTLVPTYVNPVPMNVVPDFAFDKYGYEAFCDHGARFKETKGFIINSFAELEPHAIGSLMTTPQTIYPVGPLLDLSVKEENSKWDEILTWLNDQPPSSVVFLCFGSRACFDAAQLEQIAVGLEGSHKRFLWSIRRPSPKDSLEMPIEYDNILEVPLPVGFLERTEKRGMVCGWVPQVQVLDHPAIGGFVSHCGWNSIVESLWHGVPIAAWPFFSEQQINAFELVRELGLAVDLKMDYRIGSGEVVTADVIESAINSLLKDDNPVRIKAREMKEKSRKAVGDGGSSSASLQQFIEDLLKNIQV